MGPGPAVGAAGRERSAARGRKHRATRSAAIAPSSRSPRRVVAPHPHGSWPSPEHRGPGTGRPWSGGASPRHLFRPVAGRPY